MNIIFKSMIIHSLRDKISVFYALVFPIILMLLLSIFFDGASTDIKILTGVTAVSTIFWGMQGIAFQIHSQRNKGVYKLLKLTPMPVISFVFIMVAARTILGFIITSIIWVFGIIYFNIDITFISVTTTSSFIILGILCFTSIGFLLANLASNEGQINIYANLIQIPMIFMSEAFYRLPNAPDWLLLIGKYLPFEYYVKGFNGILDRSYDNLYSGMFIVSVYFLATVLLSVFTFKWDEKQRINIRLRKTSA
ncbi:ABC transporter permease [Bacillus spongiae]|uniref:ABC transporter permease n=1 Tax=Bacillus spongiae TaxID=2683610 RepID=A0ABU8HF13_9BACI